MSVSRSHKETDGARDLSGSDRRENSDWRRRELDDVIPADQLQEGTDSLSSGYHIVFYLITLTNNTSTAVHH